MSAAGRHAPCESHRLWSLWENMTVDLQIGRFVGAFNLVTSLAQAVSQRPPNGHIQIDPRSFADLKSSVASLVEISDACHFLVISGWAKEALHEVEIAHDIGTMTGRITLSIEQSARVQAALERLRDGVIGETRTRFAFILDARSKEWWEPSAPLFGDDFKNRFQRSQYELDEAAKCLAVGRGTAAVFHLMRIMESGLRATYWCLGLTTPLIGNNRNWGNILNEIRKKINETPKGWPEKDFFQEISALLTAVKDAWRNCTMHIETKYTPEEAIHIFNTVCGFMMKLASRCDEEGEPKA